MAVKKEKQFFAHPARNGLIVLLVNGDLIVANSVGFKTMQSMILSADLSEKVKINLLSKINDITSFQKEEAEVTIELFDEKRKYRIGEKAIDPRSGKIAILTKEGWKALDSLVKK